jgi:hypothetical protein
MNRIALLTGMIMLFLQVHSYAQTDGCTDPAANNFNPLATRNDGSCTYNAVSRTPTLKANLNAALVENSGLIFWNNRIWTHNDGGNSTALFELDTTGTIIRTVNVSNAVNVDWEDIAQDESYVYVGDFGNNASGNRQDLIIYQIAKADLLAGNTVTASLIRFSYADQTDFTAVAANTTNFDCEAMIAYNGKLYLFTKQWTALGTSVYELPTTPGTWSAQKIGSNTAPAGLVTGADVSPAQRSIAICGYTSGGARFLYFLYDFTGTDFFSGNKRFVTMSGLGQTEGIAFKNPEYIFVSRENLSRVVLGIPINITQALETVNLTTLLQPYYQLLPIESIKLQVQHTTAGREIKWEVFPADEFTRGWLQRSASGNNFENVYLIPNAKGKYIDEDPMLMQQQAYYRVLALDKDNRPAYSKEVKVAPLPGTTNVKITASNVEMVSTSRLPGVIRIFDIKGSKWIEQSYVQVKKIDISSLPRGQFIVVVSAQDGNILTRKSFIR